MTDRIRYVPSTLEGQIRCTDGTLVIFVPDDGEPAPDAWTDPSSDPMGDLQQATADIQALGSTPPHVRTAG